MKILSKSRLLGLILFAALANLPALAQGCAMCRANARATPKEGQKAINRAIFLMMLPPIGAVTLGTGLVVRYARRRDRENDNQT